MILSCKRIQLNPVIVRKIEDILNSTDEFFINLIFPMNFLKFKILFSELIIKIPVV